MNLCAVRFNCLWAVFFSGYQQAYGAIFGGHSNKNQFPNLMHFQFVLSFFKSTSNFHERVSTQMAIKTLVFGG